MANVVITGTSRGIGLELVKLMAAKGHEILALSRNVNPVKDLALANIHSFPFDITGPEDMVNLSTYLKKNFQKVDVLINNSGALINKPFMETTAEDFKAVYDVNVFGLAEITRQVLPFMKKNGHVVTISSMGGIQGSAKFPGLSAYSSSKGAVITLTELWAEEFKESGPSFNVLALGAVQTEMLAEAFPGYKASLSAVEMAKYIADFSLTGQQFYNGKVLQVSNSTP